MRIGAAGIVFDDAGQILLHLRDDTRTWGFPGGTIEIGELPPEAVVREVAEETGLQVDPDHLIGLFLMPSAAGMPLLSFTFRCRLLGGVLRPSPESPEVGFFPARALPRPILGLHRERLQIALSDNGRHPIMMRHTVTPRLRAVNFLLRRAIYPYKNLRRCLAGGGRYATPPSWQAGAFALIRNDENQVLWVKRTDYDVWNLPGGRVEPGEAPWEATLRETREETGLDVRVTRLSGVYFKPPQPEIVFAFNAEAVSGELRTGPEAAGFAYFTPGSEPGENTLPKQIERVAADGEEIVFRVQSGPPGLVALGVMQEQ